MQMREEEAGKSVPTDLRWRINQLESEKLDLASKHNQEVIRPVKNHTKKQSVT